MTDTVCVVGAGPAGLAMARALKQKGVAFEVFDSASPNPDHAAGRKCPGECLVSRRISRRSVEGSA